MDMVDLTNAIREVIQKHIEPMEVVGQPSLHGTEWRAMVAVQPSGPLVLMGFNITINSRTE